MAEIVDIIHNLQYNVTGNGLQQAASGVRQQLSLLQIQGEQMMRLQRLYDSTNANEVQKRQRLLAMMDRQRQAITQQAAATERQILTDRRLQQGMEREIGIIGTLQLKLDLLQKARTRATSEGAIRDYDRQIRQLEGRMARLNGQGGGGIGSQILQGIGIGGGIGIANLIGSTLGKVKEFAKDSFQAAANMESLTAAFNTLLGSRDKASALLGDLQKFAQETPFEFNQLTELSKQLLAFGYAGDEIIPTLRMLGDVAGGVGADKLPNIVYAMGQIRAAGKLTGQDLLILINAGFNPLQVISEKTGKSITALKKDMEKGLITFKDVEGAFRTATSQGGKFFNLMQSQSKTTAGALSNFGDAVDQLKVAIGDTATGPVKDFVEGLAGMVNAWRDYISLSPVEKLQEERIELNALVGAIISVKDNQQVRNDLVAELNTKYPDFLQGLKIEGDLSATLAQRLATVNAQYDVRINKLQAVALAEANQNLFKSSISKQANATFVAAQLAQAAGLDISKVNTADPAALRKVLGGVMNNPKALQGVMATPGFTDKLKKIYEKNVSFLDRPITRAAMAAGMDASSGELNALLKGLDQTLSESQQEGTVSRAVMRTAETNLAKATAAEAGLLDKQISGLQTRIAQAKSKGEKIDVLQFDLDALLKQKAGLAPAVTPIGTPDSGTKKGGKGKDPYTIRKEQVETAARNAAREDGALKDLLEQEKLLRATYATWLATDNEAMLPEKRKEREEQFNRELGRLDLWRKQRINILEQSTQGQLITVAQLFKRPGEEAKAKDQLANARQEGERLQIDLLQKADIVAHIDVTSVQMDFAADGGLMQRTEEGVSAFLSDFKAGAKGRKGEAKTAKEKFRDNIDAYATLTNSAVSAYDTIAQAGEAAADREIAARERRLTDAQRLAERGNVEALRLEEERLEKAHKLKEEYARQQQAINSALSVSNALVAVTQAAAEGGAFAPATIAAAIGALIAGYAAVQGMGFSEGGYTGDGGKYEPAGFVHRGEVVFSQRDVAAFGGAKQLEDFRKRLHQREYIPPVLPFEVEQAGQDGKLAVEVQGLKSEMRKVVTAVSALSSPGVNIDREGIAVITLEQQAKNRKRWGAA